MSVLSFEKPAKKMPVWEWASISADCAPPGVYTSNMSDEDRMRWKARLVGVKSGNHQIEIRTEKVRANLLLVVNGAMPVQRPAPRYARTHSTPYEVKLTTNGQTYFSGEAWQEMEEAIMDARRILHMVDGIAGPEVQKAALSLIKEGHNPLGRIRPGGDHR